MTTQPPALKMPKPPAPKAHGKGEPPQGAADTVVVGNNTKTPKAKALVDCNFKVEAEFRKQFRLFCATHDANHVDIFKTSLIEFMDRKGWDTNALKAILKASENKE